MSAAPPAAAEVSSSGWTHYLVPTDFLGTVKDDLVTISDAHYNFQDAKVKEAAKRVFCALGMAGAAVLLALTTWDVIWYSIGLALKLGLSIGVYIVARDFFETSRGDPKKTFGTLQAQADALMATGQSVLSMVKASQSVPSVATPFENS